MLVKSKSQTSAQHMNEKSKSNEAYTICLLSDILYRTTDVTRKRKHVPYRKKWTQKMCLKSKPSSRKRKWIVGDYPVPSKQNKKKERTKKEKNS